MMLALRWLFPALTMMLALRWLFRWSLRSWSRIRSIRPTLLSVFLARVFVRWLSLRFDLSFWRPRRKCLEGTCRPFQGPGFWRLVHYRLTEATRCALHLCPSASQEPPKGTFGFPS